MRNPADADWERAVAFELDSLRAEGLTDATRELAEQIVSAERKREVAERIASYGRE